MGAITAILKIAFALGTSQNIASVRAVVEALVSIGALVKADGTPVTEAELTALWAEARAILVTLGNEALESQQRLERARELAQQVNRNVDLNGPAIDINRLTPEASRAVKAVLASFNI